MDLTQTIQYTRERGYDVKPGDVVNVARGPDYGAKGVVQSMDFPNACLTLLCDGDRSLINIQIRFVIKVQNTNLSSFKKDISQEVFVIGGEWKGYQGTLHSLTANNCTIALHGQQHTTFELHEVATNVTPPVEMAPTGLSTFITGPGPSSSNRWVTWSTSPRDVDVAHDPATNINPSSSISDPWTIDVNDSIDARIEKPGHTQMISDPKGFDLSLYTVPLS
ncbi:hypothetical protein BD769DRAFT_1681243 [Suillus cothurnatus]|nr:hypothetical protein BD769DRAFT_1681243 [Suillus cothurnatus]